MEVRYPDVHVEVFGEYPTAAQLLGDPKPTAQKAPKPRAY